VDSVAPVGVRGDPDVVAACCKSVAAAQRQLWKLRWDNHYKEVYWRLVVNGLATTERMHMQDCGCVCGPVVGGPPGRVQGKQAIVFSIHPCWVSVSDSCQTTHTCGKASKSRPNGEQWCW
jgi:hypothetical protein